MYTNHYQRCFNFNNNFIQIIPQITNVKGGDLMFKAMQRTPHSNFPEKICDVLEHATKLVISMTIFINVLTNFIEQISKLI